MVRSEISKKKKKGKISHYLYSNLSQNYTNFVYGEVPCGQMGLVTSGYLFDF